MMTMMMTDRVSEWEAAPCMVKVASLLLPRNRRGNISSLNICESYLRVYECPEEASREVKEGGWVSKCALGKEDAPRDQFCISFFEEGEKRGKEKRKKCGAKIESERRRRRRRRRRRDDGGGGGCGGAACSGRMLRGEFERLQGCEIFGGGTFMRSLPLGGEAAERAAPEPAGGAAAGEERRRRVKVVIPAALKTKRAEKRERMDAFRSVLGQLHALHSLGVPNNRVFRVESYLEKAPLSMKSLLGVGARKFSFTSKADLRRLQNLTEAVKMCYAGECLARFERPLLSLGHALSQVEIVRGGAYPVPPTLPIELLTAQCELAMSIVFALSHYGSCGCPPRRCPKSQSSSGRGGFAALLSCTTTSAFSPSSSFALEFWVSKRRTRYSPCAAIACGRCGKRTVVEACFGQRRILQSALRSKAINLQSSTSKRTLTQTHSSSS